METVTLHVYFQSTKWVGQMACLRQALDSTLRAVCELILRRCYKQIDKSYLVYLNAVSLWVKFNQNIDSQITFPCLILYL